MSPEFGAAAKVLNDLVEHHVQEEENGPIRRDDRFWRDADIRFGCFVGGDRWRTDQTLTGARRAPHGFASFG